MRTVPSRAWLLCEEQMGLDDPKAVAERKNRRGSANGETLADLARFASGANIGRAELWACEGRSSYFATSSHIMKYIHLPVSLITAG